MSFPLICAAPTAKCISSRAAAENQSRARGIYILIDLLFGSPRLMHHEFMHAFPACDNRRVTIPSREKRHWRLWLRTRNAFRERDVSPPCGIQCRNTALVDSRSSQLVSSRVTTTFIVKPRLYSCNYVLLALL